MVTTERRREFLVEPGSGVALSPDIDNYLDRRAQFIQLTGLSPSDLVSSPLVRIPIPQGMKDPHGVPLRWDGVKPEALWHPFFWLPASVALRARVVDEDGRERIESDEEYLIRVIVQCVQAGLLEVDTGTWLDVPSKFGIDVDDPDTRARLVRWEQGAEDPLFDRIDIEPLFAGCDINSDIVRNATGQTPLYVLAQWAYTSEHLGRTISDLQEDDRDLGIEPEVQRARTLQALATAHLGFSGGDLIGDTETLRQIEHLMASLEQHEGSDIDLIHAQLLQLSAKVHVETKPYLEQVNEAALEAKAA